MLTGYADQLLTTGEYSILINAHHICIHYHNDFMLGKFLIITFL